MGASASTGLPVSEPMYMLYWQGTLELPDLPLQKGSVKLLTQRWECASAPRSSLTLRRLPALRSPVPDKTRQSSNVEKELADSERVEVFKEEPLGGPRQIERSTIAVKELQSHFEILAGRKVSARAGKTPEGNGDVTQGCWAAFPDSATPFSLP